MALLPMRISRSPAERCWKNENGRRHEVLEEVEASPRVEARAQREQHVPADDRREHRESDQRLAPPAAKGSSRSWRLPRGIMRSMR